ncbi:SUMO ligase siz1 [Mortierella claussenii]|nr:SUMO ligase siz1 [Mortierella claussenii]
MEDLSTITGRIIPSLLVTQLKSLIKNLNESIRPPPQLKLSGNKSELINRLVGFITQYHEIGDQAVIRQIRHCVAAYSQGDVSITTPSVPLHNPHNSNSGGSSSNSSNVYRIPSGSSTGAAMIGSKSGPGSQSVPPHHAGMSVYRVPQGQNIGAHQYQHRSAASAQIPTQIFKSSPFYKDTQTLTLPRLCVEAKDRTLSVCLTFTVPPMLAVQLKKDSDYQLMVFCAWADSATSPVLMEFPHVCEIKVNGRVLEANLRGMKNKPGTVSPANITRLCRLEAADYNKVEFIYANSTKRYYVSTHLVKKISVESIVAEIERGKFLSKERMLRMIEDRNKDEDIMATSSTLSLKCPLGFQRITIPYFKDILNSTPKSLESITVQADGSWELPSTSQTQELVVPSPRKKAAPSGDSVFVIDEDESDTDQADMASATPAKPSKPAVEVIDLISDSEDEEEPEQPVVDTDGDSTMQEAANSLQNMAAQTTTPVPPSVKTEIVENNPPSTEAGVAPAPFEIHSIAGSANASRSASSEPSPIISTRMVQIEPLQTGPSPPASRAPPAWENSEDMFMNALLNPRRKRQFDGKPDSPVHV